MLRRLLLSIVLSGLGFWYPGCAHQNRLPEGYNLGSTPIPVRIEIGEVRCGGWGEEAVCPRFSSSRAREAIKAAVMSSLPPELEGKIVFDDDYSKPPGGHGEAFTIVVRELRLAVGLVGASVQPQLSVQMKNIDGAVLWQNGAPSWVWQFQGVTDPKTQLPADNGALIYAGVQEAMEKLISKYAWAAFLNDVR